MFFVSSVRASLADQLPSAGTWIFDIGFPLAFFKVVTGVSLLTRIWTMWCCRPLASAVVNYKGEMTLPMPGYWPLKGELTDFMNRQKVQSL